jgi:ABC-type sugar transport system ATPase subunit
MSLAANESSSQAALRVDSVTKAFPGVLALDRVSTTVTRGEVHAIVGENGAGKSTLVSILVGLMKPDNGFIALGGKPLRLRNPGDARRRGISYVPQQVEAVPNLSIGRNIMLGMEGFVANRGSLDRLEEETVRQALVRAGAAFDPSVPAAQLSVPEIRLAQIARALIQPGDVIILDEPTAVLSPTDADHLLQRLRTFREQGKAVVYISHRLTEVLGLADRITVLRDGRALGTFESAGLNRSKLIALMTKPDRAIRSKADTVQKPVDLHAPPILTVDNLNQAPHVHDVTLSISSGQIVGLAGVQGSGHGHVARLIAGLEQANSGAVEIAGRRLVTSSPLDAYNAGAVLVPADRRESGIVHTMNVQDNIVLPRRCRAQRLGMRLRANEQAMSRRYVDQFEIRPNSLKTIARNLSGGNQQKVALARAWVSLPTVLLLEEPTQGIDVNAKEEVRALIEWLARGQGVGVLIATSEFDDILDLADVIHVMCLGRIVATLPGLNATYADVLQHALP